LNGSNWPWSEVQRRSHVEIYPSTPKAPSGIRPRSAAVSFKSVSDDALLEPPLGVSPFALLRLVAQPIAQILVSVIHLLTASFKPNPTNSAPVTRLTIARAEEPPRNLPLTAAANQATSKQYMVPLKMKTAPRNRNAAIL